MNKEDQCCITHRSADEQEEHSHTDANAENYFFDDNQFSNELDPLAPIISAAKSDLVARIFFGFSAAAIAWHEVGNLMAVLAFLYVYFFVPRLTSHNLQLKSGRTVKGVRPILTRSLSGRHSGKKALDVHYTCCTDDVNSKHLQREFDDMVAAVLQSCDHRKLYFAEITAELPLKNNSIFSLNIFAPVARSAQFERDAQCWKPVEVPLVPKDT